MKLKQTYAAVLLCAAALAGCGGGGGGSSAPQNLTLSGVAAKGALIGATVKVHPLKADGSVDEQSVLATAVTGTDGQYTLPAFTLPDGGRYVVIVRGGTGAKFRDEATNTEVDLSDAAPLILRALSLGATGGTGTLHVTPFSEMMFAALKKADGTIDLQKADQARSNMVGLLGFDPREVTPKTIDEAALETDPAQKERQLRLAVMLSAVSQMASAGVDGCSTGDLAEKTACVVGKLAAETSLDSYKPGSLGDDLAAAANTVIQQNRAPLGNTSFFVTLDRLNCVETACQPPAADSSTPAVQAAHQFFTDIKTTLLTLFGDGRFGSGAMGQQASKFEAAMQSVAPPVDMTGKLALTLLGGTQGYYDFLAGKGAPNYGDLPGAFSGDAVPYINAIGCTIYKDVDRTLVATAPAEANYLGCSARYRVKTQFNADGSVTNTFWRHRIALTPRTAGGTVFDYHISAQKTVCTSSSPTCTNTALQSGDAAKQIGTLTLARNAAGETTGFDIAGSLPGVINDRDGSLYNPEGKAVWAIKGNYTEQLNGSVVAQQKVTLDGSVSIYEKLGDAAAQSTLALAQGTEVVATPQGLSSLRANLKFTTAQAEMAGTLNMSEAALDKSHTRLAPMKSVFTGALRNKEAAGFVDILNGELSVTVNAASYAAYDATQPDSATNRVRAEVGVKGKVTAPDHAAIQMTAALAAYSDATGGTLDVTTDFLKANGTKLRSVKLTAPDTGTLLFSEPGTNVSVTVVHGQRLHPVKKDGVELGVINRDTGIVTFKDGSFISLN